MVTLLIVLASIFAYFAVGFGLGLWSARFARKHFSKDDIFALFMLDVFLWPFAHPAVMIFGWLPKLMKRDDNMLGTCWEYWTTYAKDRKPAK